MSGNDSGITPGNQQSLEQGNANSVVMKNEANAASSFDAGNTGSSSSDFRKTIGIYKDPSTGVGVPTSVGIIHYSKTGTHIVPARPKGV